MNIIKRYRDTNGKTVKYELEKDGWHKEFSVDEARKEANNIDNAVLLSNGEFRAKKGCHIDTVDNPSSLDVQRVVHEIVPVNNEIEKVKDEPFRGFNYYGKGYINICKKIRRYAYEGKFVVEEDKENEDLFNLIKACGDDVNSFVRGYLSVIQPYSLGKYTDKENHTIRNVWFTDIGYRTRLVIKINEAVKSTPMIISFQESKHKGMSIAGRADFSNKKCAVIIENDTDYETVTSVRYTVQRGFIQKKIKSGTMDCVGNVALVKYSDIKDEFDTTMNLFFDQLQENFGSDIIKTTPVVVLRRDTGKLSFVSNGFDSPDIINFMLDLYSTYMDAKSRKIIADMTEGLLEEISVERKDSIREAVESNFRGHNTNELCNVIKRMLR
jgi:hypothetical protein